MFHDNHSREDDAIPYYREALALGLDATRRPQALACFASSLFKSGATEEAREAAIEAVRVSRDGRLTDSVNELLGRIERRP